MLPADASDVMIAAASETVASTGQHGHDPGLTAAVEQRIRRGPRHQMRPGSDA